MRRSRWPIILAACVVVGLAIYFWLRPSLISTPTTKLESIPVLQSTVLTPRGTPVAQHQTEQARPLSDMPAPSAIQAYAKAFTMPINYWGKVVDEKSNPVPAATVVWEANNNPMPGKPGTKGEEITDTNGMFSIQSHGIGLYVEVSKSGYYQVPTETRSKLGSFGGFDNPSVIGTTDSPLGTPDNPAIYKLRTKGHAVRLIRAGKAINMNRDGSPIEIKLETVQPVSSGDLKVEAWTNDQMKDAVRHYDWWCRISVPGGGLIERKDQFDFEAPTDGYKPFDEIHMPQTAEQWDSQATREYFVKLADGRYARIRFEMVAGGDHFFTISSYLNPTPGDRNLESANP